MIIRNTKTRLTVRFLLGLFMFLISVAGFAFLAHEVVIESEDIFDTRVFRFLAAYTNPHSIRLMLFLTFFGSHVFLIPAHAFITFALLLNKRWMDAAITAFMAVSSYLITILLKNYFQRDRPNLTYIEVVNNFSFPSGHTFSSFVLAAVLMYLLWKTKWRHAIKIGISLFLLLFSLAIGVSRIVLKLHYASDVLAGLFIGIAWVIFILFLRSAFLKERTVAETVAA